MYDNCEEAYIVEHQLYTTPVKIIKRMGSFSILMLKGGGLLRLRNSRLYTTREEAEKAAAGKRRKGRRYRKNPLPYDLGL